MVVSVSKSAIAKVNIMPPEAAAHEQSLMSIISRAATDPTTDVDKLERLMAMYERITERSSEQAFNEALAAAQTEMRPVAADANNPQTRSKYASYLALDKAMRPIYTKHGFSISFNTADGAPADCIRVVCEVAHGGHSRKYQVDMPADGKGAKGGDVMTKTHAVGAGVTYGQRYLIKMIFNIAVGEDDDGNSRDTSEKISAEQLTTLVALADDVGADKGKFCKFFKVESFADITTKRYQAAIDALESKRKK